MRTYASLLSILALISFNATAVSQCGKVTTSAPAPTLVTITESQNGQIVPVHIGDDIAITFVASGGTGYEWAMQPVSSKDLTISKPEYTALKPGLAGGPLQTVFNLTMTHTGNATIRFTFSRPWMKNTPPDKTFTITLRAN